MKRTIIHVTAGSEDWTPSKTELDELSTLFNDSLATGGVVVTRTGVEVNRLLEVETPAKVKVKAKKKS